MAAEGERGSRVEAVWEALGRGERVSRTVAVPPRSSEARGSSGVRVPGALTVREGAAEAEARVGVNVGALRVHVPPRSSEARGYSAVAVPARAAEPKAAFDVPLAGGLALPQSAGDALSLFDAEGLSEPGSAVRVTHAGVALANEAVKEADDVAERDAREPLALGVEEVESLKDTVGTLLEPVRRAEGEGRELVGAVVAEGSGVMVWEPVGGLEGGAERVTEGDGRVDAEAEVAAEAEEVAPPRNKAAPELAEREGEGTGEVEGGAEGAFAAVAACAALPEAHTEAVAAPERLGSCDALAQPLASPEGVGAPVREPLAQSVGAGERDP